MTTRKQKKRKKCEKEEDRDKKNERKRTCHQSAASVHRFQYGCKFLLTTDYKPLVTILGPKKGIPYLAAA